ncbi:AAA family ATPase [Kosakonia radicincitans]|uniref:AAA family ATPase n=1 Tax=Kosakonia radicincitans TaxID=283686 RepID=UPI001D06EE0C|nr:AAA family ATPase [Kosakonia radicincitans]
MTVLQGKGRANEEINKLQAEIDSTKELIKMFKDKGNDVSFILPLEEIVRKKNIEISNIYNNSSSRDDIFASKVFKHIKHSISIFIPDINDVRLVYEQEGVKLVLYKNNKEISAQQLSQGEKSLLSLIGDLTRRLVLLNPGLENPLEGEGIVLIDEIDLHLHPSWQQTVILNLQKTFPNLQLIVTTHSPQVLSTVYSRSIRSLHEVNDILNTIPDFNFNNKIITTETPSFQTRGVMSADILSKIMGIDPIPLVDEAKWVQEYYALIEHNKYDSPLSVELWGKILQHFGEYHPVVIGCKNALRLKGMRSKIKEIKKNKKVTENKSQESKKDKE